MAGRCIYQSDSGIRVFDNFFFRWLTFDSSALQSLLCRFMPRYGGLNYIHPLIFAAKQHPGPCCMLGLGGGGVAHALAPLISDYGLTAVECHQEVIDVAATFFMTHSIPNFHTIHEDASVFVASTPQLFQHVLVDLFNANRFPESCNNEQFFAHCHRLLLPEGILAVNLANRKEQRPIVEMIQSQFSHATVILPVKNCANIVVFASKNNKIMSLLTLFKSSQQLKRLTWDEQWGTVAEFKRWSWFSR